LGCVSTDGLINNVAPFCLIVWGQTQLANGLASILNATTPLFTVFAAHFLTRDGRLTPALVTGALFGLLGVVTMIGPQVLAEGSDASHLASLAILTAGFSYGVASIYSRRFRSMGVAPIAVATGQVTASSFVLVPIALLADRTWTLSAPGIPAILAVVAPASIATVLAYILHFRTLPGAGATRAVLVTLLAPATSIPLGALLLNDRLAPRHFLGLLLIALGPEFIDGRLLRALRLVR
jgi:drug/metabolite transporter (DMT)-like permease